jgi:hypothetical protein
VYFLYRFWADHYKAIVINVTVLLSHQRMQTRRHLQQLFLQDCCVRRVAADTVAGFRPYCRSVASYQCTTQHNSFLPIQYLLFSLPPKYSVKQEQLEYFYNNLGRRFITGGDCSAKHTDWGSRLIAPRGRELLKTMERNNLITPINGRTHILAI